MWTVYALLSAVFAAATAILSKIGVRDVPSNLATAIRTVVVLITAWGIVLITGQQKSIHAITQKSLWFLIASGIATGLSWLFYFQALQLGDVSKVAPLDKLSLVFTLLLAALLLGEKMDFKTIAGGALIVAGTVVMVLK